MIILDTSVISETLAPSPSESVIEWLAAQNPRMVFITTITVAEVLYGLEILPAGRRRTRLHSAVVKLFESEFHGRTLPFDDSAALLFARIVAHRGSLGRPISQFDALIASICQSRGAAIATRNVADFEHCGIAVVNPWQV